MSRVKNPRFSSANASTSSHGSSHHALLLSGMVSPQLICHRLEFGGLAQHGIVSMPLHKIRSAHERPVLGGSSVIVPEIEVEEIDGLREWRPVQNSIFAQAIHYGFGGRN